MKKSPHAERIQEFKDVTVIHNVMTASKDRLWFCAQINDRPIVVVAGPTGSGKTTMLRQFSQEYLDSFKDEMAADPSLRPLACCTAVASGARAFDFKRLYRDGLAAINDPFFRKRGGRNDKRPASTLLYGESNAAAAYREQMENEFRNHGTLMWVIDEAHNLIGGATKGGPGDQYRILKSIAQTAGVQLVLSGTFELPDGLAESGELSRRSEIITVNRYRWLVKAELKEFASAVSTVLKRLPGKFPHPDARKNLRFFYVHTLGTVGIFKEWTTRAYSVALAEGANQLTIGHFERTRLTTKQLATINNEIIQGELQYGNDALMPDADLVSSILRGAMELTGKPKGGKQEDRRSSQASTRTRSPRLTPKDRAPTRDLVGANEV